MAPPGGVWLGGLPFDEFWDTPVPVTGIPLGVPKLMIRMVTAEIASDAVSATDRLSPDPSATFQKMACAQRLLLWLVWSILVQPVPEPTVIVGIPSDVTIESRRSPFCVPAGMLITCEVLFPEFAVGTRSTTSGNPAPADGLTEADGDGDTDAEADRDGEDDGLAEADGLRLALGDRDSDVLDDGLALALGLVLALALIDGLTDALGLTLADGLTLGDVLEDGETLALLPADGDGLEEGLIEGDTDALGDALALGLALADGLTLALALGDSAKPVPRT